MIEQKPFCGVRTHFYMYQDASSYDMFRDRRVVELCFRFDGNGAFGSTSSWHHDSQLTAQGLRSVRFFLQTA